MAKEKQKRSTATTVTVKLNKQKRKKKKEKEKKGRSHKTANSGILLYCLLIKLIETDAYFFPQQ